MSRLLAFSVFVSVVFSAPAPLEEDFSIFQTKQETHDEKFTRSDLNKNKELTFDEFLHMELAYVEAKKEEFESLDKNHDGKISLSEYEEHYHGVNSKSAAIRAEYFGKVFTEFDEDLDKALNQEELERVLAERFLVKPRENFPKLFYSFDHDHSGGLDLNEYMKFDAMFPFDQTDPIDKSLPRQHNAAGRVADAPFPKAIPADVDAAAIKAVMAQGGR